LVEAVAQPRGSAVYYRPGNVFGTASVSPVTVCEGAPKYKVAISSYAKGSGIFLLHISLGEASVPPECLRKLVLELRAKYSAHYRRVLAEVFTSYRAAKISNFTYEQQGYGELESAHRARYWFDQDKGEEYLKETQKKVK